MKDEPLINIVGATENNLDNVDIEIPSRGFVAVVGPSGSGKSTLVREIIGTTIERRRRRLSGHPTAFHPAYHPQAKSIDNLPLSLELRQQPLRGSVRSSVATYSGLADGFSRLYLRHGEQVGKDGQPTQRPKPNNILEWLRRHHSKSKVDVYEIVFSSVPLRSKQVSEVAGTRDVVHRLDSSHWEKLTVSELQERLPTGRAWLGISMQAGKAVHELAEVEIPPKFVIVVDNTLYIDHDSTRLDMSSAIPFVNPNRRIFSPNSTSFGSDRCGRCDGLGTVSSVPDTALIADPSSPILHGGLTLPMNGEKFKYFPVLDRIIRGLLLHNGYPTSASWNDVSPQLRQQILEGSFGQPTFEVKHGQTRASQGKPFAGLRDCILEKGHSKVAARELFQAMVETITCPLCDGTGLGISGRSMVWRGISYVDVLLKDLHTLWQEVGAAESNTMETEAVREHLYWLQQFSLGYLSLSRATSTLSGGEGQRLRLATRIAQHMGDTHLILDEPCRGLHPLDAIETVHALRSISHIGGLLVVDHNDAVVNQADHIIALGPGGGSLGGTVLYNGPAIDYETDDASFEVPPFATQDIDRFIEISGLTVNNVMEASFTIPVGMLTVVVGVSGSGKSSAILRGLYPAIQAKLEGVANSLTSVTLPSSISFVEAVGQQPLSRNPRSILATFVGIMDALRNHYAELSGYLSSSHFSFNTHEGACDACNGTGQSKNAAGEDFGEICHVCSGTRLTLESEQVASSGITLGRLLNHTVDDLLVKDHAAFGAFQTETLRLLSSLGLGHLQLSRSIDTLSGGEQKRLAIVRFFQERVRDSKRGILILDEPSTGLHSSDISDLYTVLREMAATAHQTLVVIEHHPSAVRQASWIVELGPGAGTRGGKITFCGPIGEFFESNTGSSHAFLSGRVSPQNRSEGQDKLVTKIIDQTQVITLQTEESDRLVFDIASAQFPDTRVWEILDILPSLHNFLKPESTEWFVSEDGLLELLKTRQCGFSPLAGELIRGLPALNDLRVKVDLLGRLGYSNGIVGNAFLPLESLHKHIDSAQDLRSVLVVHPSGAGSPITVNQTLTLSASVVWVEANGKWHMRGNRPIRKDGTFGTRLGDHHVGDVRSLLGQCQTCEGVGTLPNYDLSLIIADTDKGLLDDGFFRVEFENAFKGPLRQEIRPSAKAFANERVSDLTGPLSGMDTTTRWEFEYGFARRIPKKSTRRTDRDSDWHRWRGIHNVIYKYWRHIPDSLRSLLRESYALTPCLRCQSSGVGEESSNLVLDGRSLFVWLKKGTILELNRATEGRMASLAIALDLSLGHLPLGARVKELQVSERDLVRATAALVAPLRGASLKFDNPPNHLTQMIDKSGMFLE